MMSAHKHTETARRIADAFFPDSERGAHFLASEIYSALTDVEEETVEQCIQAARNCYLRLPRDEVIIGDILDDRVQTAIRALAKAEGRS